MRTHEEKVKILAEHEAAKFKFWQKRLILFFGLRDWFMLRRINRKIRIYNEYRALLREH